MNEEEKDKFIEELIRKSKEELNLEESDLDLKKLTEAKAYLFVYYQRKLKRRFSRKDFMDFMGMVKQNASELIDNFEAYGLMKYYGNIKIKNDRKRQYFVPNFKLIFDWDKARDIALETVSKKEKNVKTI